MRGRIMNRAVLPCAQSTLRRASAHTPAAVSALMLHTVMLHADIVHDRPHTAAEHIDC